MRLQHLHHLTTDAGEIVITTQLGLQEGGVDLQLLPLTAVAQCLQVDGTGIIDKIAVSQ